MPGQTQSLTEATIRGSAITTVQTVVNKGAVLASSLILAKLLSPSDYGIAFTATTLSAFFFVLAPWVLNDLLLSRPKQFDRESGTALLIGLSTGSLLTGAMLLAIPWLRRAEPESDSFPLLLAIAATRPIADAWMAVPWAKLRLQLRYGRIALIDGMMQLAATAATVMLAALGTGPLALVLPPIAVLIAQGAGYWYSVRGQVSIEPDAHSIKPFLRRFTMAAVSQYLNNVVKVLELLLLTWLAGPTAVGLFAFAFQLSSQANVMIANQVSGVIQPVLSHINDDPPRQFRSFLRALRLIGCVGVPISIMQGAIGAPLFRLLFGAKWEGAIPPFAVLSITQAVIFLTTPVMTLLKAQGRFRGILFWQMLHILAGTATIWALLVPWKDKCASLIAWFTQSPSTDSDMALLAALGGLLVWALGCPLALCIASTEAGYRRLDVLTSLALPWPASIAVGAVIVLLPGAIAPVIGTSGADMVAIVTSVPATLLAILLSAATSRQCRDDLRELYRRTFNRRLPRQRSLGE